MFHRPGPMRVDVPLLPGALCPWGAGGVGEIGGAGRFQELLRIPVRRRPRRRSCLSACRSSGVVPPQMPCLRSCFNANSRHAWRTGHPAQVVLAFAICLRARPVDEIGKNSSGSACAHAPASRQSVRPRVVVIRLSSRVNEAIPLETGESPLPGSPRFMQAARTIQAVPAFPERAGCTPGSRLLACHRERRLSRQIRESFRCRAFA